MTPFLRLAKDRCPLSHLAKWTSYCFRHYDFRLILFKPLISPVKKIPTGRRPCSPITPGSRNRDQGAADYGSGSWRRGGRQRVRRRGSSPRPPFGQTRDPAPSLCGCRKSMAPGQFPPRHHRRLKARLERSLFRCSKQHPVDRGTGPAHPAGSRRLVVWCGCARRRLLPDINQRPERNELQ